MRASQCLSSINDLIWLRRGINRAICGHIRRSKGRGLGYESIT